MDVRVVTPEYFPGKGYTPEAMAVAANLGVGDTWESAGVTLRRIR